MEKSVETKREREKAMVSQMIFLYCKKKHKTKKGLCQDCAELDRYARQRSDKCPFMETKTFCSNCKVHCYKPDIFPASFSLLYGSAILSILYSV